MSLLFHHEPRSLQAKLFNSLSGRLTGFSQKGAAELTRARPATAASSAMERLFLRFWRM
jgi:hypothetical protein